MHTICMSARLDLLLFCSMHDPVTSDQALCLLALCRVLHIPGQQQPAGQHASAQPDTPRCSSSGGSNSSSSGGGGMDAWEQAEQQLEALIGSDPPAASEVLQLLCCEALASVELPAGVCAELVL
jgi:hypothetical protein